MKKRYSLLTLLVLIFLSLQSVNAQITGTVFRDGNGDGIFQPNEPKVGGVTINAYNSAGALCGSAVSVPNASPNYTINGCTGAIRLEFIIPAPTACGLDNTLDFSTASGSGSKTSVQFTTNPSSNNDFGVLSNDFYVKNSNPTMFVPNYMNGSGVQGTSSDDAVLYSFLYNSSGVPSSQGGSAPDPVMLAKTHQIGSVWGTSYSKHAKRLFVAAFLKRHVGMGPDGSGAIYMIDPNNPPPDGTIPSFINLDALGFPTSGAGAYTATHPGFSDVIGSNSDRGLPDNKANPSTDASAFDQVGKVSLGDIDISEDGRYLYVINLYDRKLYQIDLQNAENPVVPTAAQVKSYDATPWLTLSCNNGVARPFGLKYYRGNIYVGVVCTGENANYPGNLRRYADDLRAYIYKVDPVGNGAGSSVEIEFPLNYDKETSSTGDNAKPHGWYNWIDDWNDLQSPVYVSLSYASHPQPILSDIEIDADGSFIISLMDRGGHQAGLRNYNAYGNGEKSYIVAGDILKTYRDPNTCEVILEANGNVGPYTSASNNPIFTNPEWGCTGPSTPNGTGASFTGYYQSGNSGSLVGNDQYGSGKEFYYGDYANIFGNNYPTPHHNEGTMGGLAILPSSGEVMVVGMDPVDNTAWSGGVYSLDNSTGGRNNGYNLYTNASQIGSGRFGKAAGLGDVEITEEIPPVEIGNRVWEDTNSNGVQDAGEPGIAGVQVQLIKAGNVIATATTDANGNYIFSNDPNGTTTSSHIYNIIQLVPGMDYIVKVPTTNGGNSLTSANSGQGSNPDLNDSDANTGSGEISVSAASIPVTGANNHSFDIGYSPASCSLTDAGKTNETCNDNGTGSDGSDDYITFSLNPTGTDLGTGYSVSVNNGGTITPTSGTYGSATSFQLQNGSADGTIYTITITDDADPNCTITTTVQQSSCSNTCTLTDAGTTNEMCNNAGTSGDPSDDYITFSLNPTGLNLSSGYTVSVDNGGTITPMSGTYGSATSFQLQAGSANGTTYTITITDNGDANCRIVTQVNQLPCSTCSVEAAIESDCNDNGTLPNENDDYFNLTVTGTVTDGTGNYAVKIGTYTSASTPSGTAVNITGDGQGGNPMLAADGTSTYTVRVEDASDSSCFIEYTVGPVDECSECPTPDCLNVQMKKN